MDSLKAKWTQNLLVSSFLFVVVCLFSNVSQKAGMWAGVGVRIETVERWAASWRWPLLQAAGAWAHRARALQNALRISPWRTYPWAFISHSRKVAPKAVHFCAPACALKLQSYETGGTCTDLVAVAVAGMDTWAKIFLTGPQERSKRRWGSFRRLKCTSDMIRISSADTVGNYPYILTRVNCIPTTCPIIF